MKIEDRGNGFVEITIGSEGILEHIEQAAQKMAKEKLASMILQKYSNEEPISEADLRYLKALGFDSNNIMRTVDEEVP